MPRAVLAGLVWTLVQAIHAQSPPLGEILVQGGSESDRVFAQRAMGLRTGRALGSEELETALAAVRATDRYRTVEGSVAAGSGGQILTVRLDPWRPLQKVIFRGDEPLSFRKKLFPEIRKGIRPGDFRILRWTEQAQQRLRDSGYPLATVRIWREDGGAKLVAEVLAGPPATIRDVRIVGDTAPFTPEYWLKVAKLTTGKTLWTRDLPREVQERLRRRMVRARRLEGQSDLQWDENTGQAILQVNPGPEVSIGFEGSWSFWWRKRKELVPIVRAGSYGPELLNEGDQRIRRYLWDLGYLDAAVSHRREQISADEIRITYAIEPGSKVRIEALEFEGNLDESEKALVKAADLPKGLLGGDPPASPQLIAAVEERIKAHYQNLGYPDVTIRRPPMKRRGDRATLVFQIREKAQRYIQNLVLQVPEGEGWQPWTLAECLAQVLCDHPIALETSDPSLRKYRGDRKNTLDRTASLRESRDPGKPGVRLYTLTSDEPLPFQRNDLALVFSALRQRAAALGAQLSLPRPTFEEDEEGNTTVCFEVPDQPRLKVQRLVVQGSDRTKSKAVFREMQLDPGSPLAADRLGKAQSNLGNLGVFQRIDALSLGDGLPEAQGRKWEEGDLLLRTAERPPWVISSSFGYDKSQGYHTGLGIQRLNVAGMGRTLDLGIRAGDATINSQTLRKMFPTGEYDRSVDMYSFGYTDPWFSPGWLEDLLAARTRFHAEAAYIEEHQDVYLLRRRRLTSDLSWRGGDHTFLTLGYRFERAEVKPAIDNISAWDLSLVSRNPDRSVISAPYFQYTRDTRDNPLDPLKGSYTSARLEVAAQLLGTSTNSSFVKLDLRQQWHLPVGYRASNGVVTFGIRAGVARPTASSAQDLPLSERFFAGGPTTFRGAEPDTLGPFDWIVLRDPDSGFTPQIKDGAQQWRAIPLGGQVLALMNLEYRFPLFGQSVWGEVFADSGQVYQYLQPGNTADTGIQQDPTLTPPQKEAADKAAFPPLRTALGLGLIFKLGIPIKIEYAADVRRILGKPRTQHQRDTQLKSLLVSAGFQF